MQILFGVFIAFGIAAAFLLQQWGSVVMMQRFALWLNSLSMAVYRSSVRRAQKIEAQNRASRQEWVRRVESNGNEVIEAA